MTTPEVGQMRTVACLDSYAPDFTFVSGSQDVDAVKEHVGESASGYDSFFVQVADGDYGMVFGMCGIVPRLSKLITRLA